MAKYADIFEAISANDVEAVKSFLPEQLEARDKHGNTPLLCTCDFYKNTSCEFYNIEIIRLLLDCGANIEARNRFDETPLHEVCWRGNDEAVTLFLDRGADIEAREKNGWTPLHLSCIYNYYKLSEILVSRGADPYALDKEGKSVLNFDTKIIKDKSGNKVHHRKILVRLREEYLNKHTLEASERTAALSSGWEMEI